MNLKNPIVASYLDEINPNMKALFLEIRETIVQAEPSFEEDIKWKNCLTYIIKGKNLIQTVLGKEKVSLIFHNGARIDDDTGLLQGDGNKTRTVRIISTSFNKEGLQEIVKKSVALLQ